MNLEKIRNDIDQIDEKIVQLLEIRMNLIQEVVKTKQTQELRVLDDSREQTILQKVQNSVQNPAYRPTIVNTYKDIMKNSRDYQKNFLKK